MIIYDQHAFPCEQHTGMSLRDYFAAKAMQANLSDPNCGDWNLDRHAEQAYKMADAMLKERSKP